MSLISKVTTVFKTLRNLGAPSSIEPLPAVFRTPILEVLGEAVSYTPPFVERYYVLSPAQAIKLNLTFVNEDNRAPKGGNVTHLHLELYHDRWIPGLSAVDVQDGKIINGGNRLEAFELANKNVLVLVRFWQPGIPVFRAIDQQAGRNLADQLTILGHSVGTRKRGAMTAIEALFINGTRKAEVDFLDPIFTRFGPIYDVLSEHVAYDSFRNSTMMAGGILAYVRCPGAVIEAFDKITSNTDCTRGTLLHLLSTLALDRDKADTGAKGLAPTGSSKYDKAKQIACGLVLYAREGNIKCKELPIDMDVIEKLKKESGITVLKTAEYFAQN